MSSHPQRASILDRLRRARVEGPVGRMPRRGPSARRARPRRQDGATRTRATREAVSAGPSARSTRLPAPNMRSCPRKFRSPISASMSIRSHGAVRGCSWAWMAHLRRSPRYASRSTWVPSSISRFMRSWCGVTSAPWLDAPWSPRGPRVRRPTLGVSWMRRGAAPSRARRRIGSPSAWSAADRRSCCSSIRRTARCSSSGAAVTGASPDCSSGR